MIAVLSAHLMSLLADSAGAPPVPCKGQGCVFPTAFSREMLIFLSLTLGMLIAHPVRGTRTMTLAKRIFLAFVAMAVLMGGFGAAVFRQEWSDAAPIVEQEAQKRGALFPPAQRKTRPLAALATGGLLVALMAGYAVQRGIVSPLLSLQQAMETFTREGGRGVLPHTTVPELHHLFMTFTAMANRLAGSHGQLMQQQKYLAATNTDLQKEIENRERVIATLQENRPHHSPVPLSLPMMFHHDGELPSVRGDRAHHQSLLAAERAIPRR